MTWMFVIVPLRASEEEERSLREAMQHMNRELLQVKNDAMEKGVKLAEKQAVERNLELALERVQLRASEIAGMDCSYTGLSYMRCEAAQQNADSS